KDVRGARRRGGKGGQKPPLHMPVTVGANRPMHTRQRGGGGRSRTCPQRVSRGIRAPGHAALIPVSATTGDSPVAPGPAALAHDTSIHTTVVKFQIVCYIGSQEETPTWRQPLGA